MSLWDRARTTGAKSTPIEFHIPANPTPSFFSQIGMFALSLRELGSPYSIAPIHVSLGHKERVPIPDSYGLAQCRDQLRWHWVTEEFVEQTYWAQGENRFRVIGDSEFVCLCDADTLLVRRIDELLEQLRASPGVAGRVVHAPQFSATKERSVRQGWEDAAQKLLGRSIDFPCRYTLRRNSNSPDNETPFCVNFGFVIGPRELVRGLGPDVSDLREKIFDLFPALPDTSPPQVHFFSGQVALALAIEKNQTPWHALPMRYNWPNDAVADALYPEEIPQIRVLHYLRRAEFRRECIFCEPESFRQFMQMRFSAAGNQLLQQRVRKLTGGIFPGHLS